MFSTKHFRTYFLSQNALCTRNSMVNKIHTYPSKREHDLVGKTICNKTAYDDVTMNIKSRC